MNNQKKRKNEWTEHRRRKKRKKKKSKGVADLTSGFLLVCLITKNRKQNYMMQNRLLNYKSHYFKIISHGNHFSP